MTSEAELPYNIDIEWDELNSRVRVWWNFPLPSREDRSLDALHDGLLRIEGVETVQVKRYSLDVEVACHVVSSDQVLVTILPLLQEFVEDRGIRPEDVYVCTDSYRPAVGIVEGTFAQVTALLGELPK